MAGVYEEITLADGASVPVREVEPGDAPALRRLVGRLSADSVYMRYFGHMKELSERRARHFAEVDGYGRFALVALDPEDEGEIVGVARYERDTKEAEYAVVVEDRLQGLGLGHALTLALVDGARSRGVQRLYALVLPENRGMLKLLGSLGLPEDIRWEGGVEYVTVHLYPEDAKKAS